MVKMMVNLPLSNEFLLFFQRYLSFYKEFLHLETGKYNDIISNNLGSLDEHVKTEQAYMLKSRGLELERAKLMAQTETPNATFKEMIFLFDLSVQDQIKLLYNDLSEVLLNLKNMNLRCNYLTKLKLQRVEIDLKKLKNQPELQALYNAQAHENGISTSIFSKKI
jgi:hypothetical protein